jgi:thiol-disulfide isomerase/thioredoxin
MLSLRNVLTLLALAVIAVGGLFLHRFDALIAFAMDGLRHNPLPAFVVRVIDEQGHPVPAFEMKLGPSGHPEGNWVVGASGQIQWPGYLTPEDGAIEAVVRADGFASTLSHFAGADRKKLLAGNAIITMHKGEKVELQFRLPQGLDWPAKLTPEVYFADQQSGVRIMWQPANRRNMKKGPSALDFNFLNAKRTDAGGFALQLAAGGEAFYVGVHSPGFLQFFERGPFTLADASNGVVLVDVPKPAVLEVNFEPGSETAGLPFDLTTLLVLQKDAYASSYEEVMSRQGDTRRQTLRLADLAPAEYQVDLVGLRKRDQQEMSRVKSHPYRYFESRNVVLRAGETRHVDFRYKSLDANAFRGDRTAKIRIVNADGSPAAARRVTVSYRSGGHGYQEVFSGNVSQSGEVQIQGITDRKPEDDAFGPYKVEVDGSQVGHFSFTKSTLIEAFGFRLPPQVGDVAPDIDLVSVSTGLRTRLRDFRGKVVCLELWSTHCGPCQPAMAKLNQLAAKKRDAWRGRVVIVPLSIDERPADVAQRVKQRQWDQLDHYWSGAEGSKGWNAPVMREFVVEGVPILLILNRNGRIAWRGHPADPSLDLAGRIEKLDRQ